MIEYIISIYSGPQDSPLRHATHVSVRKDKWALEALVFPKPQASKVDIKDRVELHAGTRKTVEETRQSWTAQIQNAGLVLHDQALRQATFDVLEQDLRRLSPDCDDELVDYLFAQIDPHLTDEDRAADAGLSSGNQNLETWGAF